MSHHAIKQKVLQCDDELSEQALSQLLKFLPGPDDVRKDMTFCNLTVCAVIDCQVARFEGSLY